MSFYRPVNVSRGSTADYRQTEWSAGGRSVDYYTIEQQYPTRNSVYQSVYNNQRLEQTEQQSSPDDAAGETLQGVKKIFVRFSDKTSVQGIIYIKEAGRCASRSVWIFLFLLGTAAVVWQLHDIVKKYLNHPIATSIDIGYSTLDFPTVTICNLNPLRMSMLHLDPKTEMYMKKQKAHWETSKFAGKPPPERPPKRPQRKRRQVSEPPGEGGEPGGGEPGNGEPGDGEPGGGDTGGGEPGGGDTGGGEPGGGEPGGGEPGGGEPGGGEPGGGEPGGGDTGGGETGGEEPVDDDAGDEEDADEAYDYDYLDEEFGEDDDAAHEDYGGGDIADEYKAELRFAEIIGKINRTTLAKMGHQKNETILSCSFNGRKCSDTNFTSFVDKKYGNCFQFNGFGHRAKPLKARDAGIIHGLNLVMYKQDREYLPGYTDNSGFRLVLNEFNTMTFPLEDGFSVPTGVEVSIGFKLVNIYRLGKPFWVCDTDEEFLKMYNNKYGISACSNTCEDRLVLAECKCIRIANINNIPVANRTSRDCQKADTKCVASVKKSIKKGGKCSCRQSCQ